MDFAESMFRAFKRGLYIVYLGGNNIEYCHIPVLMPFEFGRRRKLSSVINRAVF